jgi:hypothetical protein
MMMKGRDEKKRGRSGRGKGREIVMRAGRDRDESKVAMTPGRRW